MRASSSERDRRSEMCICTHTDMDFSFSGRYSAKHCVSYECTYVRDPDVLRPRCGDVEGATRLRTFFAFLNGDERERG